MKPGGGGTLNFTFTVPASPALEILRVRGDFADTLLPAQFYDGTNKFIAATGGPAAGGETWLAQPLEALAPLLSGRG